MTGLPKKYARMGFKKGWREFKKTKNKARTLRAGGARVAKKKTTKRRASRGFKYGAEVGAFAYGALRETGLNYARPWLDKVPFSLGQYSDELAMLGLSWALKSGKIPFVKKIPMIKEIGRAGYIIELHNLGRQLGGNVLSMTGQSKAPATSSGLQVIS